MLEVADCLHTYQLNQLPEYRPRGPVQFLMAKRIADHRPLYLDFEGEVSQDRGSVHRVVKGRYRYEEKNSSRQLVLYRESPLAVLVMPPSSIGEELFLEVVTWAIVPNPRY